ncbi:MAG: hypothetical protein ACI9KE_006210 [Polyangiales bacterium]|jgi:hypothetical protein
MITPNDLVSIREALMADAERISHVGSWVWSVRDHVVHWSDNRYSLFGHEPKAFPPTLNLTTNAKDAMPRGGKMDLSVHETSATCATLVFADKWSGDEFRDT